MDVGVGDHHVEHIPPHGVPLGASNTYICEISGAIESTISISKATSLLLIPGLR